MQLPQNEEEKNLLLRKIYDYCIKVNWQKRKLDELAKELATTRTELKKLAKKYAKETLIPNEYQQLLESINEIANFEKTNTKTKLTVINPILLELFGKETYLLWENKEEKELVLKYIYDYCIEANWDKDKLNILARKLNITIAKIKIYAKKYAKDILSEEEYESLLNHINKITTSDLELQKMTLTIINPILLEVLNKKTYLLWENDKEKEIVLKYIFNYCNEIKFSKERVEQFSKWLGISPYKINEYYKEYTLKYLNWTYEEYHKKRCEHLKNIQHIPETKKVYDALLMATTPEEIIQIIGTSKLKFQTIKDGIQNYVIKYHNSSMNIKTILKNAIKIYVDYTSNRTNSQEQIIVAITLIKLFVESKNILKIDEFLQDKGIDKNTFTNYLSLVMFNNFELFNQYALKITAPNNVLSKKRNK